MLTFTLLLLLFLAGTSLFVSAVLGLLAVTLAELFSPLPLIRGLGEVAWSSSADFILVAIPMFILMAEFVILSGVAENLFRSAAIWIGRTPGGLGIATALAEAGAHVIMSSRVEKPEVVQALKDAGDALQAANINLFALLARHAVGDWGAVSPADARENDLAVQQGFRVFSAYPLVPPEPEPVVWIITEAADDNGHRLATTLLLPEEY